MSETETIAVPSATASAEEAAGFSPYHADDPPKKDEIYDSGDDKADIRAYAAERDARDQVNGSNNDETVKVYYQDKHGNVADPDLSVTEREWEKDYQTYKEKNAEAAEQQADEKFAAEVDAARVVNAYENDPNYRAQIDALVAQQEAQQQSQPEQQQP